MVESPSAEGDSLALVEHATASHGSVSTYVPIIVETATPKGLESVDGAAARILASLGIRWSVMHGVLDLMQHGDPLSEIVAAIGDVGVEHVVSPLSAPVESATSAISSLGESVIPPADNVAQPEFVVEPVVDALASVEFCVSLLLVIDIWEERKVFGSRGQALKDEMRKPGSVSRNGKIYSSKLKQSVGILEKLVSNYECVYDGPVDEEALLGKCQNAVSSVEKMEKEIGGNFMLGNINGSQVVDELQGQSNVLRECIEQLKVTESSRASLVSNLREALHEQEIKLEQLRNQIQAAQFRLEQAGNICQQLMISNNGQLPAEPRSKETSTFSDVSPSFIQEAHSTAGEKEQSAPVKYVQQDPFSANPTHTEEHRKTAAAAVAAKLAASTSSAEMLSYVLSSLASEGVIRQQVKEDFSSDKRPKLDNGMPFMPTQASQLPAHFPHPEAFPQALASQPQIQHSSSPMSHPGPSVQPPPPPPSQPPMPPPPPPTQYMQAAGSMTSVPYSYGSAPPLRPPPLPSFPMMSIPPYPNQPNLYQNFQASESGFFSQPPLPATPPSASSRP